MSVSVCEFKRLQPRASTNFLHAWLHLWLRHTASDIHFLLFITGVLNLRSVLDAHLRSWVDSRVTCCPHTVTFKGTPDLCLFELLHASVFNCVYSLCFLFWFRCKHSSHTSFISVSVLLPPSPGHIPPTPLWDVICPRASCEWRKHLLGRSGASSAVSEPAEQSDLLIPVNSNLEARTSSCEGSDRRNQSDVTFIWYHGGKSHFLSMYSNFKGLTFKTAYRSVSWLWCSNTRVFLCGILPRTFWSWISCNDHFCRLSHSDSETTLLQFLYFYTSSETPDHMCDPDARGAAEPQRCPQRAHTNFLTHPGATSPVPTSPVGSGAAAAAEQQQQQRRSSSAEKLHVRGSILTRVLGVCVKCVNGLLHEQQVQQRLISRASCSWMTAPSSERGSPHLLHPHLLHPHLLFKSI